MKKNKTIIIAEIGVNHNGKIEIAKKLVDVAKKAGADYVKFQTFKARNLVQKNTKASQYQINNLGKNITQDTLLKKLELSENDHKKIIRYCSKRKINFMSSPFDLESLDLLFSLKIFNIKVASGEINNLIFLEKLAKIAKKIFLSSGMATLKEVSKALQILIKNGAKKKNIFVLHCHTDYPTQLNDVNLLAMNTMKKKFGLKVGYSDHTEGNETAIAATAMGAKVIEKHITLNNNMKGPDHRASLNPEKFYKYVKLIRNTETLLGSDIKKPTRSEIRNKKFIRKSIVAKKNIKKGEVFSESNLLCKRPEGGISPIYWKEVVGKKSKRNFKIDSFIFLK
jgi:N,N'-diacetyllegionaminate synthase